MAELIDKLILLCCCVLLFFSAESQTVFIIALLVSVIFSALDTYIGKYFSYFSSAVYFILCLWQPGFLAFLPLIVYDCFRTIPHVLNFLWLFPYLVRLSDGTLFLSVAVLIYSALSLVLRLRTNAALQYRSRYLDLQDRAKEISRRLESKNKELMEKQDYEVRLATLNERNRIAREIHDNVGHMLSRSILQVGALLVVNQDPAVKDGLETVKGTLSGAMDHIRASVHDLHDESLDLHTQLEALLGAFTFCPVQLDYEAGEMEKALKYCFLAITREALSNIIKHSNATAAKVTVREHPAFYQLIIQDNGTQQKKEDYRGIGLHNMEERVAAFHGKFLIDKKHGYKLFISIPKEAANR